MALHQCVVAYRVRAGDSMAWVYFEDEDTSRQAADAGWEVQSLAVAQSPAESCQANISAPAPYGADPSKTQ